MNIKNLNKHLPILNSMIAKISTQQEKVFAEIYVNLF